MIPEENLVMPKRENLEVVDYYKGQLIGNVLLKETVCLAAKKKRLLDKDDLGAEEIVSKVKFVVSQLRKASKRLLQINHGSTSGGPLTEDEEEEDDLVSTNLEKCILYKSVEREAKTPLQQRRRLLPTPPLRTPLNGVRSKIPVCTPKW